jgi:hypothetical protein
MKKVVLSLLFAINTFLLQAQTGPGGVGNSSSNILWLKADNISSLSDNDDITTWSDASGNSNDLSQSNASFKPIYKTNVLNGFPSVRFNKANGRIRRTGFTSFPTTAITAIYVNINNAENNDAFLSYTSTTDNDFLLFNSANLAIYRGTNTTSGISFNDNNWHITNASWRSVGGTEELWKDGTRSYTAAGHASGSSITTGGCLAIAGEQDAVDGGYDAAQAHFGDFTEVMVFNTYLNLAQHIIVSNYLAAKYNLTIANDYFAYESTHSNDVAGIGREDVTNTHTAAMSASVLQIQNASDLNLDQEYLIFGHDNTDLTTAWSTSEAPNGGVDIQRLAREWRIDETGDVGTIDVIVDVASFPALPVGHTMYAIMVDSDGDFSNGASVYEMSLIAGTQYSSSSVNINDGDFIAIAAVNPKIQHTITASNDFEPNNAIIEVSLNFIANTTKTIDYSTSDGTALSAQPDYTAVAGGTVSILAGNSTGNYTITIINDVTVEPSETFLITLSNPSAGINLGTNTTHTYSIHDDDDARKVYFDFSTSSGNEAVTPATVTLSINNVDLINPTSVDYSVTGGTASGSGTDYTLASGTVIFPPNTTTGSFQININNDVLYENTETIIISLSNPSNCNIDGVMPFGGTGFTSHTFSIIDNDTPPTIQFNTTTSSGSEAVSPVSFQVNLNVVSGINATATYALTGTATGSGNDYTLANGTITIPAGSLSANISASIIDDALEELSETIILTLSLPSNSTIGVNSVHTYTIIDNDIFGFVGPGGVGQSTNNKLWVKSDDIAVVADGTDITSWADASGSTNNLSQSNTTFTPRYFANIINGRPVVRFNQANGRLIHNTFTDFPSTALTTIFVNSNNDSGEGVLSYASTTSDNEYLLFSSNNLVIYRGATNVTSGTAINGNTFRILGNTWQSSDGSTQLYRNGTQTYTGTLSAGTPITTGGNFALANEQDAIDGGYTAGQAHQGDFTEIILYNVVLNSARRKIVDNYLSAKYNITIANDMFAFDAPGNYEFEVAGIGRDNATSFHQDAQGSAIVRINNPSSLDDGDFMFWGHDNATFDLSNTTDIPVGIDNRLERVWRVSKTGDLGSISVRFDLSSFTIGNSADLVLLVDNDDGSFTNASQIALSSFSGNVAIFNNVNFNSGNWFTIASLSASNPLPIELVSFSASLNKNKVELKWITSTEINNDYFTIERSANLENWEFVKELKGAGNSNTVLKYSTIDEEPLTGISYYRLKQTDFNGDFSYSDIVTVNNKGLGDIIVYPNPVKDVLNIKTNCETCIIKIYSAIGQLVYNGNEKEINTSNWAKGAYEVVIINNDGSLFNTKVIK